MFHVALVTFEERRAISMKQNIKLYFDYNIFDLILREQISFEWKENVEVYYSVSHVEEFHNAVQNDTQFRNADYLNRFKQLLLTIVKPGIILSHSPEGIIEKSETFNHCLKTVKIFDTRHVVNEAGKINNEKNSQNYKYLIEQDKTTINNSNLDEECIWKRTEVLAELEKCAFEYKKYVKSAEKQLASIYGSNSSSLVELMNYPKDIDLQYKCLEEGKVNFAVLEFYVEYLNRVLCRCGYHKDKGGRKNTSGIHDVSHMIYSSYCDYFVSDDKGLLARAKAIYDYLGINTEVMSPIELELFIKKLK